MLSRISQAENDKYHMISLMCGRQRSKHIDKENRLVVTRGEGGKGGLKG